MPQAFDRQLPFPSITTLGRTCEQIKAEIEAEFGFFPPFFEPAWQTPQVLENLWQQTLTAYVNNPLPTLFKEKLSAYLSRFCAVPYCMICHSCTLRPLGMSASEVLALLEASVPAAEDIEEHLKLLAAQSDILTNWPQPNSQFEQSLLYCSTLIAIQDASESCRQQLRQILGTVNYQHLAALIAYIKTCHVWIETHPEVAYEADKRVQENLGALLEAEPQLAEFFLNYKQRVKCECQTRAEQLAELAERRRQEQILRQQAKREQILAGMAQRIRQSLKLEEILGTTVSEVRQFLQTERVFIYRFQPDWSGYVAVESVADGWPSILGTKIKDSFFIEASCRELYKHGRIQATEDIYTAGFSKCHVDLLSRLQVRANLVVPIVEGEQLWGLLVANHCSSPRHWEQLDIDLLCALATQVAIAIQQSTLFEQVQAELSERKRNEEKIRQQAQLLDVASDAITVQTLDSQILFWNSGSERLYGWKAREAIGQNANQLLYKDSSLQLQQIQQCVLENGSWQGELHQVTKSNKEIVVSSRWTLVHDEQGQQKKSILVVNTDITEKKQIEAQFLRAQRLESIGTLATGIAHDLNNALGPILMIAELLQEKVTDVESQQLLAELEASVKRGASLVKQVLSFGRGLEGSRTIIQVKHLLSEIHQIAKQTFPKSIKIYTDIAPDLWTVCADATQLHQVLMNLVVNARDAMPDGGTLGIYAENLFIDEHYAHMNLEAKVGPYIVLTVSDTGVGIPPEILERIFEPFFTTKEVGKGTGLGLSTAMGIIKSHGGFMKVYSEVGRGTQFKVYLSATEGAQQQQAEDMELPKGNGELILVVDDELSIREITEILLEVNNYKVLTATDGIEAIALYAQHKADISVVLMDMMMPEMDGLTTIQTLGKINPYLKIIATSGLTSNDKMAEAACAGVKAFLSKPYTALELLTTLSSVLKTN
jgi:PAS domain S-box-containing protein